MLDTKHRTVFRLVWVGTVATAFAVGWGVREYREYFAWKFLGRSPAPVVLKADAAASNEAFAIATGPVDSDVDGFFTLDFLTGELQCTVINKRTGQFGGLFRTNVVRDLGVGQNAKYLMTTGRLSLPRGGYAARPAESVVYVLDTNSGNFGAYVLPWRPELASVGQPQASEIKLLSVGKARNVPIRE